MRKILTLFLTTGFLLFTTTACGSEHSKENINDAIQTEKGDDVMQIQVQGENNESIIFELNDSIAAKSFYDQLPMSIEVEDYGDNEKIFYPFDKLDTRDTPLAKGPAGTLAYYEPWGNVVMYYGDCGGASGLYALGEAITNVDQLEQINGTIEIETYQDTQTKEETPISTSHSSGTSTKEEEQMLHVQITVENQAFQVSLYDNTTTRALLKRLPLSLNMQDLHSNEKYSYLKEDLPTAASQNSQIKKGDIKLFGSDCLVLFYKDFSSSYAYTSLGYVEHPNAFIEALEKGTITVEISTV